MLDRRRFCLAATASLVIGRYLAEQALAAGE